MSHAVLEFVRYCETHGWMPSFFSSTRVVLPQAQSLGYRYVQVAEDTVIDLPDLQFKGKAWQDVRTALNRAAKSNIQFRVVATGRRVVPDGPAGPRHLRAVGLGQGPARDGVHARRYR